MPILSAWVKKLHMYTGLLNFTILMVFGIAGLTAVIRPERSFETAVETRDFQVPPNLDDLQAATAAYELLKPSLTQPPGKNSVRRDAANHVTFNAGSINGPRMITLLEEEHQLRIENRHNRIWFFLDNLHATTVAPNFPDLRLRLWSYYTEFAIWSMIFMSVTGVYLWLAARPGYRWAQISFATGTGIFLLLYAVTR